MTQTVHDHIVSAPGYVDRTRSILTTLGGGEVTSINEIIELAADPQPGFKIKLNSGSMIEVTSRLGESLKIRIIERASDVTPFVQESRSSVTSFQVLVRSLANEGVLVSATEPTAVINTELVYADGRVRPEASFLFSQFEIRSRADELSRTEGVRIELRGAFSVTIDEVDNSKELLTITTSTPFGEPITTRASFDDFDSQSLFDIAESVQIPFQPRDTDLSLVDPIARKVVGVEIYLAGPASELPVTENERKVSPVLNTIPKTSAANFRYADKVERLAQKLTPQAPKKTLSGVRLMQAMSAMSEPAVSMRRPVKGGEADFIVRTPPSGPRPLGVNSDDLARFAISRWGQRRQFPRWKTPITLKLNVERMQGSAETGIEYRLTSTSKVLLTDPAYREALEELITDPLMAELLAAKTTKGSAALTIPIRDGRPDIQRLSLTPGTAVKRRDQSIA